MERKRERVAKACDHCRAKKIKCNGLVPCKSCLGSDIECVYELSRQRRAKKATDVPLRLARLERLVLRMALRLEVESDDLAELPKSENAFFQQCKSVMNEALETTHDFPVRYKGPHLGWQIIITENTVQWIRLQLAEQDRYIVTPMELLVVHMSVWKKLFSSVWLEPRPITAEDIASLKLGRFPKDKLLVFEALKEYTRVQFANFVADYAQIVALFTDYYAGKRFSYLELMLMTLLLCLLLSEVVHQRNSQRKTLLERYPLEKLVELQEGMFMSVVHYFQRISVVCEGLISIQALLLLVVYLETSWVTSDVNVSFTLMAVRYAQEMGIHRFETFQHLGEDEMVRRTHLWAACQYLDGEISYRTGQPPAVNVTDVSTLTATDPNTVLDYTLIAHLKKGRCLLLLPHDDHHHFFLHKLLQLRGATYYTLFSALVRYDSLRQVQRIVESLNDDMLALVAEMEPQFRPRLYTDPEFDAVLAQFTRKFEPQHGIEPLLSLHLTYFQHLMTINRVPWQVVPELLEPQGENHVFRKLSLDSARTVLHLVRALSRETVPLLTINWLIIFPFVAMMNLLGNCLNRSQDPDCLRDLSLLIDVLMNFFGYFGALTEAETTRLHYLRLHMVDVFVRIIMRITIKVVELLCGMDILGKNPALKNHLEVVQTMYPQFYAEISDSLDMQRLFKLALNAMCVNEARLPNWQLTPPSALGLTPGDPFLANILHTLTFGMDDKSVWDDPRLVPTDDFLSHNFFFDNGL